MDKTSPELEAVQELTDSELESADTDPIELALGDPTIDLRHLEAMATDLRRL